MNRTIIHITNTAILLAIIAGVFPVHAVFAERMTSSNYTLQSDSVNFAGGRSTSASYTMEDTAGEIATGDSSSANYQNHAGFQQSSSTAAAAVTPTPTPTPTETVTPGGGGTTGGEFLSSFPVNVINFTATPGQTSILLDWIYPVGDVAGVKIVRSDKFFPSSPDEGTVIFEGDALQVIDHDVVPGVTYYYALFARTSKGQYSSGVLASAKLLTMAGEQPSTPDIISGIPIIDNVDPAIAALTLLDFDFIQDGRKIVHTKNNIVIDARKNLTIALAYNKVPEILKSIAISLGDPQDPKKVFTFLLRINKDKTAYEATIAPLGGRGVYKLNAIVLDYKNQGMKKLTGNLRALALDSIEGLFFRTTTNMPAVLVILVLIFALIAFILIKRRKSGQAAAIGATLLAFILYIVVAINPVHAAINKQINYQGKLADSSDTLVANGTYQIQFNLYTQASGGSPIWTETYSGANEIQVTNGLFSVLLGQLSSLNAIDFNQTLYLGVTVEGDSEMSPRKTLGAVPAAFVADTLDGLDSTAFLRIDAGSASFGYFTATSTTQASTFPFASTTALSATTLCLSTDCRTSWPTSGSGANFDWIQQTNYGTLTLTPSTTLPVWIKDQLLASSSAIIGGSVTANNFVATGTATNVFPYASSTALTAVTAFTTNLNIGSLNGVLFGTNGAVGTVATSSLGLPQFSDLNSYLSLSSWYSTTTDQLREGTNNLYYTDARVNSYIAASTTLPKVYTSNTFTNTNTFNGGVTIGSLTGTLQAINGAVSASSTLSVAYGGTGLSTAPTYGQILVGNNSGGYALTATSSLGLPTFADIAGSSRAADWNKQLNYNVLSLTPTTTIPVWLKDQLFASSSAIFAGKITANNFVATGTASSIFPYASTTALSATTLCLSTDCRTAWPSFSQVNDWIQQTNYNTLALTSSTTIPVWVKDQFFASSSAVIAGNVRASTFTATSTNATSTFAGGLSVGNGALQYDFTSGITSIDNLTLGSLSFDTNAGMVSWSDLPVTSDAALGTPQGYTAQINGNPLLTLYSESDGAGGIQNVGVGIGTTSPYMTFAVNGNSIIAGNILASNFTATSSVASIFPYASTTALTTGNLFANNFTLSTLNGPLQTNNGVVSATSTIAAVYGGTGFSSYTVGDMLYANSASTFAKLGVGGNGTCLTSNGTQPAWGSCGGAGGTGSGTWSTTTSNVANEFINYPNNASDIVVVGGTSTTSAKFYFDPNTQKAFLAGNTTIGTGLTIGTLTGPLQGVNGAVSASSTLSVAYGGTGLSTAPSYGNLLVGDNSGGYALTATSSLGLPTFADIAANSRSFDWNQQTNYGVLTLTPSTTIPVWIKDQLFASSSAIIAGDVTASTFTATSSNATSTFAGGIQANGFINVAAGKAYEYNGKNFVYGDIANTNAFFGVAGNQTTTGSSNVGVGSGALSSNTAGSSNTAVGVASLLSNTTGIQNTATGHGALLLNTEGRDNTAVGYIALQANTIGTALTGVGYGALNITTGASSTAVGYNAGVSNTSGTLNTFLGYRSNALSGTLTNATAIGANARVDISNALVLGDQVNVGIGTTSPYARLSVGGNAVVTDNVLSSYFTATSTTASTFPYASTTALSATTLCLSTDCRTAWPTFTSIASDWNQQANYNRLTLTPSTTLPVWFKDQVFASSSAIFAGLVTANNFVATSGTASTFPYASTTALTTTNLFATRLSNLTTNGFIKTSGSDGTLSVDTNSYLLANSTDWQKQNNYGVLTLTPSTTIPVWFKDQVFASSSAVFAGRVTANNFVATSGTASVLPYASSTAITVSGSIYNTSLATGCVTSVNGLLTSTGNGCGVTGAVGSWSTTTSQVSGQNINYSNNATDIVAIGNTSTTTAKYFFDPNSQLAYLAGKVGVGSTSPFATFAINPVAGVAANQFVIGSSTATNFIVTNSGDVGIGTTSPQFKLGVNGSIGATSAFIGGTTLASNAVTADSFFAKDPTWYVKPAGSSNIAALLNGNVGIGTTTPFATLAVNPVAGAASNQFVVGSSTGTSFIINNSGFVGVGTTTPGSIFAVGGVANFTSATTTMYSSGGFNLAGGCFAIRGECISTGGGNGTVQSGSAGQFAYYGSDGTVVAGNSILTTSGSNIGVGTTSPYAKLSVNGDAAFANFYAYSTTATSTIAGGLNIGNGGLVYNFSTGRTSIDYLSVGAMSFDTNAGFVSWSDLPVTSAAPQGTVEGYIAQINSNPVLTLYSESDGAGGIQNVGVSIGSTTPYAKLSVWGNGTTTGKAFEVANAASTTLLSITDAGKTTLLYGSSTALTATNLFALTASTTNLSIGSLTGILQAINGSVSASSTLSVAYGGTGLSTAPTFGQLLVGNSTGGYTLTATSSLGLPTFANISAFPFTTATNYNTTTNSTTSPIWLRDQLFASSSAIFAGNVTANTFIATGTTASIFPYASTTAISASSQVASVNFLATGSTTLQNFTGRNATTTNATSTNFFTTNFNATNSTTTNLTIGSLTGPLQAINGLVSASSTLSVAYGGTGLSTAPTFGQLLVGNSTGGYTLTATSSLGLPTLATLSSYLLNSSVDWQQQTNFNTLTLTSSTTIPVWIKDQLFASSSAVIAGNVRASNFTATSTTASVFPYASTTALSTNTLCLSTDCRTAWPSFSQTNDWNKQTNYGVLTLTPSTTIPVWVKDQLFASSSAVIAGNVRASNFTATTTNATSTFAGGLEVDGMLLNLGLATFGNYGHSEFGAGLLGVNSDAVLTTSHVFTSLPDTRDATGIGSYISVNAPSDLSTGVNGLESIVKSTTNSTSYSNLTGGYLEATYGSTGLATYTAGLDARSYNIWHGTVDYANGIQAIVGNTSTGTTTTGVVLDTYLQNFSAGQITNGYGIYVNTPQNSGGGRIVNNYGLYIDNQSGVSGITNSYNFYSAGTDARNIFEGSVGIGTTSPFTKLSVAGGNIHVGGVVISTSTTASNIFPYASTTALSATTLCLSTDCRTAWPSVGGGAFPFTTTSNFNQTANSTTTQLWLRGSPIALSASSTSIFDYASTTAFTSSGNTYLAQSGGAVGVGTTSLSNARLTVDGDTMLSGHVGIGAYKVPTTASVLDVREALTTTGSLNGIQSVVRTNAGSSNNINNLTGASFSVDHSGSGTATNLTGLSFDVTTGSNSSTVNNVYGILGDVHSFFDNTVGVAYGEKLLPIRMAGAGSIANAYGIYLEGAKSDGGGSIGTSYGAYIGKAVNSGSTLTNNFGLYLDDQSSAGSSLSYNLYSTGTTSKNYFGGFVGIGTTSPYAKLSVAGNAVVGADLRASLFISTSTTSNIFPYASTTALSATTICLSTDCRTSWPSGSGSAGTWSTTTSQIAGQFVNYSNNTNDIVAIGGNSTTTAKFWFDPATSTAAINGKLILKDAFNSINISNGTGVNTLYGGRNSINIRSDGAAGLGDFFQNVGDYSTLIGYRNYNWAGVASSTIVGFNNGIDDSDYNSTLSHISVFGDSNNAYIGTSYSSLLGYHNYAQTTIFSSAVGINNNTEGPFANSAFGYGNNTFSSAASAFGYNNTIGISTDAASSTAIGYSNTLNAASTTVIGSYITNNIANSFMAGVSDAAKLTILSTGETKAPYFTATSTTASTFSYASTTALSATTLCLIGDNCRTTWPSSGGAFPFTTASTYNQTVNSTTSALWFRDNIYASSTSFILGSAASNNSLFKMYTVDDSSTAHGVIVEDPTNLYGSWQNPGGLDGITVDSSGNTITKTGNLTLNYYSSGNVSIAKGGGNTIVGDSAPLAYSRLSVKGKGTGTGQLFALIDSASTTLVQVLDNGNFGIGTTSPYAKLSVVGQVAGAYFTATTTTASVFPYASTTALSATTICLTGDTCRTTWPTGGAGSVGNWFAGTTNFNQAANSTTTALWLRGSPISLMASSTSVFDSATSTYLQSTSNTYLATAGGKVGVGTTSAFATLAVNPIAGQAANQFVVGSSTATTFIINNTGTVGIGTASPDNNYKLYVNGPGYFNGAVQGGSLIADDGSAGQPSFRFLNDSSVGMWLPGTDTLAFSTNGEVMRLSSTGNVGIGTTSPYAKLSVVGEVVAPFYTATSTTATSTFAGGLSVGNGAFQYDFSSGITSIDNLSLGSVSFDTNAGIVSWSDLPVTSSAAAGTPEGYVAQINGNPLLTLYSESDGAGSVRNLGVSIGSTSPYAKLSVWANGTGTGKAFEIADSASSTILSVQDNGTTYIRSLLGIGTTSPAAALGVRGNIFANNITATNFFSTSTSASVFPYASTTALSATTICLTGDTCRTTWPTGGAGSVGNWFAGTTNFNQAANSTTTALWLRGSPISLMASSTSVFDYASSTGLTTYGNTYLAQNGGTVNVGTTNPIDTGATFFVNGYISSGASNNTFGMYRFGNGGSSISGNGAGLSTDNLVFNTNFAERMRLDGIGNLGIGTTSPYRQLSVAASAVVGDNILSSYFTATSSRASVFPYASTTALTVSGSTYFPGLSDGCLKVTSGLLGSQTCTAGGSGGGSWSTTTSNVAGQFINYPNNTTDIAVIGATATTSAKYFFDPNIGRAYLSGNVGIGTTSPYAVLSVAGAGGVVAESFQATSTTATSTLAGGLNVGNGGLVYDFSTGITSIAAAQIGAMNFDDDAGVVSWANLPITNAVSGLAQSYTASIDDNPLLTLYGLSDGSGSATSLGVSIGSSTPYSKLSVWGDSATIGSAFAAVNSASSTLFQINNNGNVAVGSTSPGTLFGIQGVASFTTGTSTIVSSGGLNMLSGCFAVRGTCIGGGTGNGSGTVNNGSTGQFAFYTTSGTTLDGSSLLTTASGNIGIGTSTPGARLAVNGDIMGNAIIGQYFYATSTTATSTFNGGVQIGSGAGDSVFQFGGDQVAWSLAYLSSDNSFRIASSTSGVTNSLLTLSKAADVGVSSTTPWRTLSVTGTVGLSSSLTSGTTGNYLCINNTTFEVTTGTTCSASSERFKENINPISYGLDAVKALQPVSFTYKPTSDPDSRLRLGFIAEQVQTVLPELVNLDKDGLPESVDYAKLTPVLTKAIQELNDKVDFFLGSTSTSPFSATSTLVASIASSTAEKLTNDDSFIAMIAAKVIDMLQSTGSWIADQMTAKVALIDTVQANTINAGSITATSSLTVGSNNLPTGITIYDRATNMPYCLSVKNGIFYPIQGDCGSESAQNFTPDPNTPPGTGTTPPPSETPTTTPTTGTTTPSTGTTDTGTSTSTPPVVILPPIDTTASSTPTTTEGTTTASTTTP